MIVVIVIIVGVVVIIIIIIIIIILTWGILYTHELTFLKVSEKDIKGNPNFQGI